LIQILILTPTPAADSSPSDTPNPTSPAIQALLDGLLSEKTDLTVRINQTRALLLDPAAHPALIDILLKDNHLSAKRIICRTIAVQNNDNLPIDGDPVVPAEFIDPLFTSLSSQDDELSAWAAQALARFHAHPIVLKLAIIVSDPQQSLASRLAAVHALELTPGKAPVLALGAVLENTDPTLQAAAAGALTKMLALPTPMSPKDYKEIYLPKLEQIEEHTFLIRQLELRQSQLHNATNNIQSLQIQINLWKERFLTAQSQIWNKITDPQEKLDTLKNALLPDSDEMLRIWAVRQINDWAAVAATQSGPLAQPLIELLTPRIIDDSPTVRELTADALRKLADMALPTAGRLLDQLTIEKDIPTQIALLDTLATFEYTPAATHALKLLDATDAALVAQAARTLGRLALARTNPLSTEQLDQISPQLLQTEQKWTDTTDVRREIIQTVRRLAARDDYLQKARQLFGQTLTAALAHPENTIRSAAVPAVTELYQTDVLPLLLTPQNFLLDDEDTSVRFAVAQAIQKYGQAKHLLLLNNRLQIEPHPETAKTLRDAFIHILSTKTGSIQDMAIWVKKLHNPNNNTPKELQLLHDQIVQALWQKISQAKTTGVHVPPDFESLALTRLLNLDLPQETKDTYRLKLIQLSLITPHQPDLLQQAQHALAALESRPAALDAFNHIESTYDQFDLNEEPTLFQAAAIVTALICPLEHFPNDSLSQSWQKKRTQLALLLIDNQIKLLTSQQQDNPSTIETLSQLDERLTNYPHDQPAQNRLDALENFRTILQSPDKTDTAASENINNM